MENLRNFHDFVKEQKLSGVGNVVGHPVFHIVLLDNFDTIDYSMTSKSQNLKLKNISLRET